MPYFMYVLTRSIHDIAIKLDPDENTSSKTIRQQLIDGNMDCYERHLAGTKTSHINFNIKYVNDGSTP